MKYKLPAGSDIILCEEDEHIHSLLNKTKNRTYVVSARDCYYNDSEFIQYEWNENYWWIRLPANNLNISMILIEKDLLVPLSRY